MATIEKLWLKYSGGKFGYSVQAEIWRRKKCDFENFCRTIGWNTKNEEVRQLHYTFLNMTAYLYTRFKGITCLDLREYVT